jgi:pimeloyl-ACP methyl ester carboxylesterase
MPLPLVVQLANAGDPTNDASLALALQTGPVILVGHSWGGAVITAAGVDPKVAGLVYVAAFAPDSDEVGRRRSRRGTSSPRKTRQSHPMKNAFFRSA